MYLQENFIKKLGARQCDCWGEGGIMGLSGNGKNTIKVKFFKKINKERRDKNKKAPQQFYVLV